MNAVKKAINLTVLAGRGISQTEVLPLLADAGFDGCFYVAEEGSRVKEIADAAREHGLILSFVHAPVRKVDTLWTEGPEGEEKFRELIFWLRQCAEAQVPCMVSHVWTKFADVTPNQLGIDRFGALLELGQKEGVSVAFENAEVDKFLETVHAAFCSHPAAGFCFDSGHELCYNHGADQLAAYGEKLLCTHLNDNLGQTGPEITSADDAHMVPFDGIADWEGIARRLSACRFKGPLTYEIKMKYKPGRHTHDRYATLTPEEILGLICQRDRQFQALLEKAGASAG